MRLKVLGPPGTGKTTKVLEYISQYQKREDIQSIALCSFTVSAKDEAEQRLRAQLTMEKVTASTVHAFAFNHMKFKKSYMVNTLSKFAESIGEKTQIKNDRNILNAKTPLEKAIAFHHHRRSLMDTGHLYLPSGITMETIEHYIASFENYKKQQGFLDYNDVLLRYIKDGTPLDFDVAFIDEAQDLSVLQHMAVKKMFMHAKDQIMAGDDDQTIFGFAGVKTINFIEWEADRVEVLTKSWRLGVNICNYSKHVLNLISHRMDKPFDPSPHDTTVRVSNVINPYEDILPFDSCVILHRNGYISAGVKKMLNNMAVPYSGVGSPFSLITPLKAIRKWDAWTRGEQMYGADIHCMEKFFRESLKFEEYELGRKAMAPACPFKDMPWYVALDLPYVDVYKKVFDAHGLDVLLAPPKLEVTTIHQAKGGEWDKVIVLTDVSAATFKQFKFGTQEDKDAEARVWYVALTRAKYALQIVRPQTQKFYPLKGVL